MAQLNADTGGTGVAEDFSSVFGSVTAPNGSLVHTVSVVSEARPGIVGSIEKEVDAQGEFVSAWRIVRRAGVFEHTIRLEKLPLSTARGLCERIGQIAGVRRSRIEHLWLSGRAAAAGA